VESAFQPLLETLNRSVHSVERKLREIAARPKELAEDLSELDNLSTEQNNETQSISWTTSTPVKTVDQALDKAEVDSNSWAIDRFVINSWEQAAKVKNEDETYRIVKTPLWQVKVWLKRKKGFSPEEMRAEIINALSSKTPKNRKKIKAP
jgi:hypothetical protein